MLVYCNGDCTGRCLPSSTRLCSVVRGALLWSLDAAVARRGPSFLVLVTTLAGSLSGHTKTAASLLIPLPCCRRLLPSRSLFETSA